jgi:excisionase family DNA binding protein
LVADGELRAARIGRLVRIPRSELERYLAARLDAQQI